MTLDPISYKKAKEALELARQVVDGEVDLGVLRTEIDKKLNDLETQYAPQLTEVTAQLADNTNKIGILNEQLAEKAKQSDLDQLNKTAVARTLKKLQQQQYIKGALMGDSLMTEYYNVGAFLLSSSKSYSLLNTFGIPADRITLDNYAIGGTTAELMLSFCVPIVYSTYGNARSTAVNTYTNKMPNFLAKKYDFIILSTGTNQLETYDNFYYVALEHFIRINKQNGTEIILISPPRAKNATTKPRVHSELKKLSQHYDIALIDMDEEYLKAAGDWTTAFNTYYSDSIHQSNAGTDVWANAISNLLSPANAALARNISFNYNDLPKQIYYFHSNHANNVKTYECFFIPAETQSYTGVLEPVVSGDGLKSPAVVHGLTNMVTLSVGQSVTVGVENALCIIPIVKLYGVGTSVMGVYPNMTSEPILSISYPANARPAYSVVGYSYADFTGAPDLNGVNTKAHIATTKFELQSGEPLSVLGFLVFSHLGEKIKPSDKRVTKTGTWFDYADLSGADTISGTNTLGDKIEIDFIGDAIYVEFKRSSSGGISTITLDGTPMGTVDNYGAPPYKTEIFRAAGYGKHKLSIQYTGNNHSAAAGTTDKPKLAIKSFKIINDSDNLTEIDVLKRTW